MFQDQGHWKSSIKYASFSIATYHIPKIFRIFMKAMKAWEGNAILTSFHISRKKSKRQPPFIWRVFFSSNYSNFDIYQIDQTNPKFYQKMTNKRARKSILEGLGKLEVLDWACRLHWELGNVCRAGPTSQLLQSAFLSENCAKSRAELAVPARFCSSQLF